MRYKVKFSLKKIRENKGLTQPQLSKISGVSQSYISEIENFKKSPTLDTIEKLANALNVHPYEFQQVQNLE